VGVVLIAFGREGVDGAPSANSMRPNFHLFWTQVASTLERAVCEWPLIESERPPIAD
jgi:hypothetical protein